MRLLSQQPINLVIAFLLPVNLIRRRFLNKSQTLHEIVIKLLGGR